MQVVFWQTVYYKLKSSGKEVWGTYSSHKIDHDYIKLDVMNTKELVNIYDRYKPNVIVWTVMNAPIEEKIAEKSIRVLAEQMQQTKTINAIGEELNKAAYLELYQKMYDAVGEKGDFSHMMYTISANLIDEGYGVENQWDNKLAKETSWDDAEQRKDVSGWLGDAVYDGTNGKVSFGMDDFIADLDADNIVHLVTEDKSLMDAANEYYNKLQENEEEYRKKYSWEIIHMKI